MDWKKNPKKPNIIGDLGYTAGACSDLMTLIRQISEGGKLEEQVSKINRMRNSVISSLEKVMPEVAFEIEHKGYFLAPLHFKNAPKKIYVIMDFTSKQIEHLHDLETYSIKIFKNFIGKMGNC